MEESMIKSGGMIALLLVSTPNLFSILASLAATIYFLSMLKVNVVDQKYNGSWGSYFKSIFKKKPKNI